MAMIRWYDYIVALLAADVIVGFVFNGGMFGGLVAYGIYWAWEEIYCNWRRVQEHTRK